MCWDAGQGSVWTLRAGDVPLGQGQGAPTVVCPVPPPTASLQGLDCSCHAGPPATLHSWQPPHTPGGRARPGAGENWDGVLWDWGSLGRASGAQCGVAGKEGRESRDERTLQSRGNKVSLEVLGPITVQRWPLASPPPSVVTSRSRPPPGGGGAFPLCGPGVPGPTPGPLPPGRSLPVGGGGGGVPGVGLPGSARPLPLPARQLSARPARLPRAANAERPLPLLPDR